MAADVNPRRRYHSPLRIEQAEQTRRRVLGAARRLFVERGYAGTTVAAVAHAAGVSPDTVYVALGGKRGLLEGVLELAVSGLDDPASLSEQRFREQMRQLGDPRQRLRLWVDYSCRVLARTSPVHAIIRGAADGDEFAADLRTRLLQRRLNGQTAVIREYLAGALHPGLTLEDAGERFCALSSPELHHLLVVELGWPAERHEAWLTRLLESELLDP
jgi:AcrR family transcriptional regulator